MALETADAAGAIQVTARYKLPVGEADYQVVYRLTRDGRIGIETAYTPGSGKPALLPRFGVTWAMPQAYDRVAWYGRGPHETYWDRQTSGEIAVYESTVDELVFPYVRSQDTGNRTDVRWMTLTNKDGLGVRIEGTLPLSASAWPFTIADVEAAMHPYELPRRDFNTVFVDDRLHGVGGDNSWGALHAPAVHAARRPAVPAGIHNRPAAPAGGKVARPLLESGDLSPLWAPARLQCRYGLCPIEMLGDFAEAPTSSPRQAANSILAAASTWPSFQIAPDAQIKTPTTRYRILQSDFDSVRLIHVPSPLGAQPILVKTVPGFNE